MKCKGDGTTSLWRRYSEFELLRNYLEIMYPAVVVPPLPEKKVRSGIQKCSKISNNFLFPFLGESGTVVECMTRDRGAAGSSLTGVTALCP